MLLSVCCSFAVVFLSVVAAAVGVVGVGVVVVGGGGGGGSVGVAVVIVVAAVVVALLPLTSLLSCSLYLFASFFWLFCCFVSVFGTCVCSCSYSCS